MTGCAFGQVPPPRLPPQLCLQTCHPPTSSGRYYAWAHGAVICPCALQFASQTLQCSARLTAGGALLRLGNKCVCSVRAFQLSGLVFMAAVLTGRIFGGVSLPRSSCQSSNRGQHCCCCRFKRVGALFSSPSFIHSGMWIRRRRVEGWVKWLWETLRSPECVFPRAAPPSRPPPLVSGGYLLEESWMCLDERGVSRSDLKPSQRCALTNSGGMFLVLASLTSPVSRVQRPL